MSAEILAAETPALQSLGYVGLRAGNTDDWLAYGTRLLGMQIVDKSAKTLALRMDDRKQRVIVSADGGEGMGFMGFEVANAATLDGLAAKLERHEVKVTHGSRALADERGVAGLIVFNDPAGNRLEAFHGQQIAPDAFIPGRSISGFRTGPLGMGHVVLTAERSDDVIPFYRDVLDFRLSDFFVKPVKIHFFHINPRHHTVGILETGKNGIHHMMVEVNFLDDIGQGYDIAQMTPDLVKQTLGRHINDHVTSFYTANPSNFMIEYGWGGRSIDVDNWTPKEVVEGPSLWGHERMWLPPEGRTVARELRMGLAQEGLRIPLDVMEGNHAVAPGTCMLWDKIGEAKKRGYV
jgi:2,3-dihydroxybiphenyl 1,2-dioxygenase